MLTIQEKIRDFTKQELAEYWNRSTGRTTDIGIFATSVDDYLVKVRQLRSATQERSSSQDDLVGKRELYAIFFKKAHGGSKPEHTSRERDADFNIPNQKYNAETRVAQKQLKVVLAEWGYESEAQFAKDIKQYR